jgi:hypothetical protein
MCYLLLHNDGPPLRPSPYQSFRDRQTDKAVLPAEDEMVDRLRLRAEEEERGTHRAARAS